MGHARRRFFAFLCGITLIATASRAAEKTERFDADPKWEGINNRPGATDQRKVRQDFGYSQTSHIPGPAGEIGGFISPASEPAYVAKPIPPKSFADGFEASGKFLCAGRQHHILIGFFNSAAVNEWRTPNSIAIRLQGRGDISYAYVEYCTSKWRAGGDTPGGFATVKDAQSGRLEPRGFRTGVVHTWSLKYDPKANKGTGSVTVTIDNETAICHLDEGHKADGATFNRIGMLNIVKSPDDGGEVWLRDVAIDGKAEDFTRDPEWEAVGNRRTYTTSDYRPRFDFGYSPTHFSGGKAAGELGGLVFRGDCRYKPRMGAYGDRLQALTLEKPIKAGGTIAMRRGTSDSTTLLGFYHATDSLEVNPSQKSGFPKSFLGVAIEGPSRDGFFVYPVYRTREAGQGYAYNANSPQIMPDGKAHRWSLAYDPAGTGKITVTMGDKSTTLELVKGDKAAGATFNRFGLVTTWIDGNAQRVYFDDLTYTVSQD